MTQADSDPGVVAVLVDALSRRLLRGVKRMIRPLWMGRLTRRNLTSSRSLLDPSGPVVSLTTYGERIGSVHYTIESIGAGRQRPSRIMLWIDQALLDRGLPDTLVRLQARGLEVHGGTDLGPHTKYFHAAMCLSEGQSLVTADDDILYPRSWLSRLVEAASRQPQFVHCHRAHRIAFDRSGSLLRYSDWPPCRSTRPSPRNFLTGVGGVIYPPAMLAAIRDAGDRFRTSCPRQDDIWLTAVAFRSGILIRQTSPFHPVLFELPGTRAGGLARHNVQGGANDVQLRVTFSDAELDALRQAD